MSAEIETPNVDAVAVVADDKPFSVNDIIVSKNDHYLAIVTFSLMGMSQLLIWNFVLTVFWSLQFYVWPEHVFTDLLGGFEHAAALLISIVMLKFNGLSTKLCHITGLVNTVLYVLFPLVPTFLASTCALNSKGGLEAIDNDKNVNLAKVLLCMVCTLLGLCSGLFHVQGFAFAAITPYNYCGYVSVGNGIAGVVSFLTYTLLFKILPRTQKGQIQLIWIFFALGACCSLVQTVGFFFLSKKKWFKQCVQLSSKIHSEESEKTLRTWGEPRGVIAVFKDCWMQAFNASFTLLITLFLFPVNGPYGWHQTEDIGNYLNGTFQVIDLLTRWIPTLGGWTKLPKKVLFSGVLIRPLIMIPLFLIPVKIKGVPFLGATWWLFILMALFTITNGWFVSLATIYNPQCVQHPKEKEIASDIYVILMLTFVTIGVFASGIPKYI